MKIGIIGAGHAGLALAALLLRSGKHEVRIYSAPRHSAKLSAIMNGGGHMRFVDQPNSETMILRLTKDQIVSSILEIIEFSEAIYNTTPVTAHDQIFHELLADPNSRLRHLCLRKQRHGFRIRVQHRYFHRVSTGIKVYRKPVDLHALGAFGKRPENFSIGN